MEKRYQVFVSSTFRDLELERQEVMHALLELDCTPSGMELFPAANETQWNLIKKVIDDCDYYVLVIGGRYGSIGPEGISYTEMETGTHFQLVNRPSPSCIVVPERSSLTTQSPLPKGRRNFKRFVTRSRRNFASTGTRHRNSAPLSAEA